MKVTAIVVTFNRPTLLIKALEAVASQTRTPDHILVVDNASTDETPALLRDFKAASPIPVDIVRATSNLGGAGGFSLAMQHVGQATDHWLWLMDDDAQPEDMCLEQLITLATDPANIVGPAAVGHPPQQNQLCWPLAPVHGESSRTLPSSSSPIAVSHLPFLGILLSQEMVRTVGLPENRLFISGDDTDYCLRARNKGARIFLHPSAILFHPLPNIESLTFFGRRIWIQHLPPMKRYFEVRNRIWLGRQHSGRLGALKVAAGSILRWSIAMLRQKDRISQSAAFACAIFDGLLGRIGKRPFGP